MTKRGGDAEKWEGGYKRRKANGQHVYVIYARRSGKLYEISTRCTSSSAAEDHWRRFQSNPEAYRPEGDAPRSSLPLDLAISTAFLEHSRDVKQNTPKWVRNQRAALQWWAKRLGQQDLRTLSTARALKELDTKSRGKKQLIATFKAFYGWLRKDRHLIETAQDPFLGQIRVPQARVAQETKVKAVEAPHFKKTVKKLSGWARDCFEVLSATGWHITELERFASGGSIERHPITKAPVLVSPRAKRGNVLRTQVGPGPRAAAERILKRGHLNYWELHRVLKNLEAGFNPGVMRHTVATWAVNTGADISAVSSFLNHRSLATARKFYATHAVPAKVPTMKL